MIESQVHTIVLLLLVGACIILSMLIKAGFKQMGLPALVGYLALGFMLRLLDATQASFLSQEVLAGFAFLADIGIIVLLFRVGLESDLAGLLKQLPRASVLWIGNVLVSGGLGYLAAYYLLALPLLPSLFVAIAFTATSVGVSVGVWQDAKALKSSNGALLLDVAELDDISGIFFMGLLFSLAPILKEGLGRNLLPTLLRTTGLLFFWLFVFIIGCIVFSRFAERPLSHFFSTNESQPGPMLTVAGTGFIIAGLAGLLGFSIAIGAFFAGLVFSRDPGVVKINASFDSLYDLFSPFFFIGIGLSIDPGVLTSALGPGLLLLLVAVLGKMIGTSAPALLMTDGKSAFLLGLSMIPRAEIAMVIMYQGHHLGEWAVSSELFGAMVLVSAATCLIAPLTLYPLLSRWPQAEGRSL